MHPVNGLEKFPSSSSLSLIAVMSENVWQQVCPLGGGEQNGNLDITPAISRGGKVVIWRKTQVWASLRTRMTMKGM